MKTSVQSTFFFTTFLVSILSLAMLASSVVAATVPAVVENREVISLKGRMEALADQQGSLAINDVVVHAERFTPVDVYPALGFTRSTYWFRVPLFRDGHSPESWVLKLNPTYLDHVSVWIEQNGQVSQEKKIGRRDYGHAGYVLSGPMQTALDIPVGTSSLYLRVQTVTTLAVIPALMRPDIFIQSNDKTTFKVGLLGGVMLIVFVFNMTCWWLTRINMYGVFGGYVGFGLLSILEGLGMLTGHLVPQWPFEDIRPLSIFLGCSWLLGFVFFRIILIDKQRNRWIYRTYQLLYVLAGSAVVSGLFGGYFYSYVAEVLGPVTLLVLVLTLIPALRMIISGKTPAIKIQGIAYLPLAFYLGSNQLLIAGWITPSMLNIFGQTQGGMLQIFLLQTALLYRVRDLMQERSQAIAEADRVRQEVERERKVREEQSRFLSMITHEIRTPLAVVDMAVQSLRVSDYEATPFQETRYSRIQSAVKRMATLLELGLQKDSFNNDIWQPDTAVDLTLISNKVTTQFPVDQRWRIDLECDRGVPVIEGNVAALKLTFFNLVENAMKYSGDKDKVLVTVGTTAKTAYWQVEDRGRGISSEQQAHMFDKFFRAAETSGKPGLGLGLYISRQVVERHGGSIEYLTSRWGGACFRCHFPRGKGV